ncbi:ROK family protein [Actinokineospora alba]|uniref:ROK family protein n=1 Tax=Actinokineospora alba TaxID=504798 RepID=UPI001414FDDA|nr:ROK family protein [Actinokineospora alba]
MASPTDSVTARSTASAGANSAAALLTDLQRLGPLARKQLCRTTGLSFTTVTRMCASLIEIGVLAELEPRPSERTGPGRAGRPEIPLDFAAGGRLLVGVHIRPWSTTCTVFDLTAAELSHAEYVHPAGASPGELLAAGVAMTADVLSTVDISRTLGIGVSIGGLVDHDRRVSVESPMLGWREVDLGAAFDPLGLAVHVDSSVRCLALDQLWRRGSQVGDTSLTLFVSEIVGAAIIVDRRLRRGPGASAGNILHFPVHDGPGTVCSCGRRNCLSAVVSNPALYDQALAVGAAPPDTQWHTPVYKYQDNPVMAALRRRRAGWLGEAAGTLIELLNPDTTVIAGHLGTQDDIDHMFAVARSRCSTTLGARPTSVLHREAGADVWDRASVSLVLDDYLRHPARYEPALA